MTCPNCKKPDAVKCGYKDGSEISWCTHCGQIRWCSDGLIPKAAQGLDNHAEYCERVLGIKAFGCAIEAEDGPESCCKNWCGHHYCPTAPNLAFVEPGDIEYNSWSKP